MELEINQEILRCAGASRRQACPLPPCRRTVVATSCVESGSPLRTLHEADLGVFRPSSPPSSTHLCVSPLRAPPPLRAALGLQAQAPPPDWPSHENMHREVFHGARGGLQRQVHRPVLHDSVSPTLRPGEKVTKPRVVVECLTSCVPPFSSFLVCPTFVRSTWHTASVVCVCRPVFVGVERPFLIVEWNVGTKLPA